MDSSINHAYPDIRMFGNRQFLRQKMCGEFRSKYNCKLRNVLQNEWTADLCNVTVSCLYNNSKKI